MVDINKQASPATPTQPGKANSRGSQVHCYSDIAIWVWYGLVMYFFMVAEVLIISHMAFQSSPVVTFLKGVP